jgi:hypothetical protein
MATTVIFAWQTLHLTKAVSYGYLPNLVGIGFTGGGLMSTKLQIIRWLACPWSLIR